MSVGTNPLWGVLLCQVEHDCNRLGEHEVVVNEHWDSAGRIDLEELRATVFAGHEVDGYRPEVYAQLLECPSRPNRPRRSEFI